MLVFFVLGLATVISQTVLARELLVVFFGSELSLGIIFGAWLLWISVGSGIGRWVQRWIGRPHRWLLASATLALLAPIGEVLIARGARLWLHVPPGMWTPLPQATLTALAALAPQCLLVGFAFPLGPRVDDGDRQLPWAPVSRVYAAEAAGSLVGGVLFAFVLASHVSSLLVLAGTAAFGVLAVSAWAPGRSGARTTVRILAAVLLGGGILWFARPLDSRSAHARWASLTTTSQMKLVDWRDTHYQRVSIGLFADLYSVFCDGHYAFSFPDPYAAKELAPCLLSQHPRPQRILLIGSGLDDVAAEMAQAPSVRVDIVQLDGRLADEVHKYHPPPSPERVHHIFGDERHYLQSVTDRYDLIVVYLPDPSTALLNRYFTREFYRAAARALSPGGVFITSSVSSAVYLGDTMRQCLGTLFATLTAEFKHVLIIPGERALLAASNRAGQVTRDFDVIAQRFADSSYPDPMLYTALTQSRFLGGQSQAQEQDLRTTSWPLNTDLHPRLYILHVRLWAEQAEARTVRWLMSLKKEHIAAGAVALFVLSLLRTLTSRRATALQRSRRRSRVAAYAAALAGCAAMGLQIVLLIAYQTAVGSVYTAIALLTAVFMLGFTGGSAFTAARRTESWSIAHRLALSMAATAALAAVLPGVVAWVGRTSPPAIICNLLYGAVVLASGFLTGIILPLCVAACGADEDSAPINLALVSRSDHLGAAVGAATTATVLLPNLGLSLTCWLFAAGCALWSLVLRQTAPTTSDPSN